MSPEDDACFAIGEMDVGMVALFFSNFAYLVGEVKRLFEVFECEFFF